MIKPHFTAEIQLGHLIQAGAIIVTVGSAVLGGYLSVNASISRQDTRIALVELAQKSRAEDDGSWRSEMRQQNISLNAALAQLSREVADLRVAIAGKMDRR